MESTEIDALLDELRATLPTPVAEKVRRNGDRTLICGQPGEVVVRVAGDRITVAEYAVKWHGPHTPDEENGTGLISGRGEGANSRAIER